MEGPVTQPASVFISYSSRDRRDAFAIKQLLESHRMDKADDTSDMTTWVEAFRAMTGFPVLLKLDPMPQLARWTYLGKLSGLAKMLRADEAHAYTGLAKYTEAGSTVLGRIYIVMARRKTFAWKLALSIETACFDGMPEERVYSQDHVRAGAIFGTLKLGA